ncbi:hypothetical protein LguiA_004832 [Lonicera macranthoides]
MGKKKFIDKKKSATFQLLARDSSDANYEEGPSSDRVFVRIDDNPYSINSFSNEHNDAVSSDPKSIFADAPDDYDGEDEGGCGESRGGQIQFPLPSSGLSLPDHIRKEILELGFPDDGYNYLSHLREIKKSGGGSAYYENSKANLDLPSDVKAYDASRVQIPKLSDASDEKAIYSVASKTVGVRIQRVVDPEVAALLDDSDLSRFGSDIEDLEEDFVVNASLSEEPSHLEPDKKLPLVLELDIKKKERNVSYSYCPNENITRFLGADGVGNHMCNTREGSVVDEKARVRRPLDEQFDLLELQEYGTDSEDEYVGALDEENEYQDEPPLAEKLNHALKDHVKDDLQLDEKYKAPSDLLQDQEIPKDSLESAAAVIHRCREYGQKYENENQDDVVVIEEESSDESEIWDCETIVTTYSNLDNHPGKIDAPTRRKKKLAETVFGVSTLPTQVISLKGKEKLPVDFLPHSKKSGTEKLKEASRFKAELQKRKQHGQESKEEKKERKVAVKEERREARRVKKEMKELYKSEGQHAQKVAAFSGPSSIHLM